MAVAHTCHLAGSHPTRDGKCSTCVPCNAHRITVKDTGLIVCRHCDTDAGVNAALTKNKP